MRAMRISSPKNTLQPARILNVSVLLAMLAMTLVSCAAVPGAEPPIDFAPVDADHANGIVYSDLNLNGRQDPDEPGIIGVGVSNGRDVVETDSLGRYRIAIDDDDIIFVIKPPGFRYPQDAFNRARFYYVHRPRGSPQLAGPGIAPTGRLPASLDFALIPQPLRREFEILVFADTQVRTGGHMYYLDQTIARPLKNQMRFAFGMTLGDIVYDRLDWFEQVSEVIAKIGIPWFNVIGNHDINKDALNPDDANDSFQQSFGPDYYAFNEGKVHFVVLNSMRFNGVKDGRARYRSGLMPEQLDFLRNDLARVPKDHLVVVAFHHPITNLPKHPFRAEDLKSLMGLLSPFANTLSLSGHTHLQTRWFLGAEQGWTGASAHHHYNVGAVSGSWWRGPLDSRGLPAPKMRDGTPHGYAQIRFRDNQYELEYRAARHPHDHRMAIYQVQGEGGGQWLYVNYFLGSQRSRLEYQMAGGGWIPLEQAIEVDPLSREEWLAMTEGGKSPRGKRKLPRPGPSWHLWKARLPELAGGRALRVRVTDSGKQFSEEVVVRRGPLRQKVEALNF